MKSKKKTGDNHAFLRDNCASIWRNTLNRHFVEKRQKVIFISKFQSVHANCHKLNDNCNKASKLATSDNITTAPYTSFFEISSQLGSYQPGGGRGGSYFPYILLNEIQTMFSQLAKRSARILPADLCNDHAHYLKNHRSTVLGKTKTAVEGGTVSHYYILVIRKFIDFMSLFRHSVWFSFSVKQFPFAEFGICNI